MSYYSRPGEDDIDEFDELDLTPYGGGYDARLTYGRPLEPCEETCYTPSTPSVGDFDYARPQFSSGSEPSAYADEALQTEYSGYARPKPRPASTYVDGPCGYGDENEPGYGRRPEYEQSDSSYGQKPEFERPGSEFESGCCRLPEFEQPPLSEFGYEKPSYGMSEEEEEGYEKPSYGRKYDDSDDEKRKSYGYGGEKGYGRKCVGETRKVLAKVFNKGWFKLYLMLFLVVTSRPIDVSSEDIGNPLIPGSTAMNALLANKNLRGLTLSERRQMLGTQTPINNNDFPWGNSPPNSPAHEQANPYQRDCKIENRCRQGSKGKKN